MNATLNEASASLSRVNLTAAINQLQAFQKQGQGTGGPSNKALSDILIAAAQDIINALR